MASIEHERGRLHRAVDNFIDSVGNESYEYDNLKVDTFGIVSIGTWDDDGDEAEAPFQWFETRRHHVKLGILHTCMLELEGNYVTGGARNDDDDEEDEEEYGGE